MQGTASVRPFRALVAAAVAALAGLLLLAAGAARADTSTQLTIVGTSDVNDSGLFPNLILPEFHAAYPQFSPLVYKGNATLTAITDAENGSLGASVLIVHAASLENQFVANGYSYEPDGRALFTNDFVLAGPTGDPAGVDPGDANNIVQAFEDIATAGYNGGGTPKVTFVSRGGGPGTTVEEHQIWASVAQNNPPAGLLLCTVPSSLGGGMTPIATGGVAAMGDACPGNALPGSGSSGAGNLPPWYITTGVSQGMNVVDANACTLGSIQSPTGNSCYVLTDRGTWDYLLSGNDPAGNVSNLKVVTRQNSASAPGGADLLVNYFHGYIINPNKTVLGGTTKEPVNLPAAQDFLNFLTSPTIQSQLKSYLDTTSDPEGPPFVADASPTISLSTGFPSTDAAGHSITVSGQVIQNEPGYPAISNQSVSVDELVAGVPVSVPGATAKTASNGDFSIQFTPPSSGSYQVSTGQIQQIENPNLTPVYGDILSPASTSASSLTVSGSVSIASAKASAGGVTVSGTVGPAAPDGNATVSILARKQGSSGSFTVVGAVALTAGQTSYAANGTLGAGKWQLETKYVDPGEFTSATSGASNVTVPSTSTLIAFKRHKVKKGELTVTGSLSPASANGGKIELFALKATAARGFKEIGKATIKAGHGTFTVKGRLARGVYVLQLEYLPNGAPASFSKISTVSVH
jgi:ABC-type tungstate transport system permease subunit